MGKIKIFIITLLFLPLFLYTQKVTKILTVIKEKDPVEIKLIGKTSYMKFLFKENIENNKKQKKMILVDGTIYCEKCKKESYDIIVKKETKDLSKVNTKHITVNQFLYNNKGYSDYFLYKNKFYSYQGRIEN